MKRSRLTLLIASFAVYLGLSLAPSALAHETDQMTVPLGKQFADLGPFLTDMVYDNIHAAVEQTNARIRRALDGRASESELARLQSEDEVVEAVRHEFPPAITLIDKVERKTESSQMHDRYPGQITSFKEFSCIYDHASFVLDPRQFFKIWRSSTVMVNGSYVGTDKIGHFLDKGYMCYRDYRVALARGKSESEAIAESIKLGTGGDLLFSERGLLGRLSSGSYSNADLCADFLGRKFYQNLTMEVAVRGKTRPPMLLRDGEFWKVSDHVRRDSDFFVIFFSDHMDEALNPNYYEGAMRKPIREAVAKRAEKLLQWYADANGERRTRAWFDAKLAELKTYYGEYYGYDGDYEDLVTIGNTCFDLPRDRPSDVQPALFYACNHNSIHDIPALLGRGASVRAEVHLPRMSEYTDGDTALHIAARHRNVDVARVLIDHHAPVTAVNRRDVSPLHLAAGNHDLTALLITSGAAVNGVDALQRTPLHWAAAHPDDGTIQALLAAGALKDPRDSLGQTPLHRAVEAGLVDTVAALLASDCPTNSPDSAGLRPLHLASRLQDPIIADMLISRGADVNVADAFGRTPLHDAALHGRPEIIELLIAAGADITRTDSQGVTPLHLAARQGWHAAAETLLQHGADPSPRTRLGATPLHEAAFNGRAPIVRALLSAGANATATDDLGHTPRDIAAERRNKDAIAALATPSTH